MGKITVHKDVFCDPAARFTAEYAFDRVLAEEMHDRCGVPYDGMYYMAETRAKAISGLKKLLQATAEDMLKTCK